MVIAALDLDPAGVVLVAAILPTLATGTFVARILDRRWRRRVSFEVEDWTLSASIFLLWVLAIICFVGVGVGALGQHSQPASSSSHNGNTIERTSADDKAERIVQGYSIVEKLTYLALKASVVLAYRRIFPSQTMRLTCLGTLVFLVCQCVAFIAASAKQCRERSWGIWYEGWAIEHHCAQAELVWVGYSVSDVATDLFILCLPMPCLLRMSMSRAKKTSVVIMFLLGSLSTAVGIARMIYLLDFTFSGGKGFRDLLGLQSSCLVWSMIEASVAMIAANISAMRNLIFRDRRGNTRSLWEKIGSSQKSRSKSRSESHGDAYAVQLVAPLTIGGGKNEMDRDRKSTYA